MACLIHRFPRSSETPSNNCCFPCSFSDHVGYSQSTPSPRRPGARIAPNLYNVAAHGWAVLLFSSRFLFLKFPSMFSRAPPAGPQKALTPSRLSAWPGSRLPLLRVFAVIRLNPSCAEGTRYSRLSAVTIGRPLKLASPVPFPRCRAFPFLHLA